MKTDNQMVDNTVREKLPATLLTPKINNEISSCGCKGNCSSRCGCVKKNNKCNPSCKCDDKICKNQKFKHNYENKENVNKNDAGTFKKQNAKKSKAMGTVVNNKDLLKSDIENIYNDTDDKEKYKHVQEEYIDNIHSCFTENAENVKVQNLQADSDCTNIATVKKKRKEKRQNNDGKPHLTKVEEKIDENTITNAPKVIANSISCESDASIDSMMVKIDVKYYITYK